MDQITRTWGYPGASAPARSALADGEPTYGLVPNAPGTLVDLLRQRARVQPGDLAYEFLLDGEDRTLPLSYAELDQRVRHGAAVLQAAGAQGEPVLLLFPPGVEYVVAFLACMYAGAVAVPAYPPQGNQHAERVRRIAQDANARTVLTSAGLRDAVGAQFAGDGVCVAAPLAWTGDRADCWVPPDVGPDTLTLLQYTSGSTGSPRGVMLTHANLLHNLGLIARGLGITPDDKVLSWLPPYHDMGLIGGVLLPLFTGRPGVLMAPAHFLQKPFRWLRAISRHRATVSGGPNFAYDLCLRKIGPEQRAELDLSCWKVAVNGAEPVQPRTLSEFGRVFAEHGFGPEALTPCYGLAEATLMVTGAPRDEPPVTRAFDARRLEAGRAQVAPEGGRLLAGCGRPYVGQTVRIVDPDTSEPCADAQVGEIWVAGPSVAQGYWRQPAQTAESFGGRLAEVRGGSFLRTGDLGFVVDGELFVTGRIKDLVIIRGRNHYPQDVEELVGASHGALRGGGGAAFSVPGDEDEALVVVHEVGREAVRTVDGDAVAAAVRGAVAQEFGLQLFDVVLLRPGGLPKTSSGKVRRRACREQYLAGALATLAPR